MLELRLLLLALSFAARPVGGQGPGNGIGKSTYAASDPSAALAWMMEHLPVEARLLLLRAPPRRPPASHARRKTALLLLSVSPL